MGQLHNRIREGKSGVPHQGLIVAVRPGSKNKIQTTTILLNQSHLPCYRFYFTQFWQFNIL